MPADPQEIVDGVVHWAAHHPRIGAVVHSHYHVPSQTAFDPLLPDGVADWLEEHGPPKRVVLSNRHHLRAARELADRFGCPILCHEAGLHEFDDSDEVVGFGFDTELADGVTALELGAITSEETVLHLAAGPGALLFADGLVRGGDGQLAFVPDGLLGDDPEAVKDGLRAGLRALADEQEFDALLFAHGAPLARGGRDALRAFLDETPT